MEVGEDDPVKTSGAKAVSLTGGVIGEISGDGGRGGSEERLGCRRGESFALPAEAMLAKPDENSDEDYLRKEFTLYAV